MSWSLRIWPIASRWLMLSFGPAAFGAPREAVRLTSLPVEGACCGFSLEVSSFSIWDGSNFVSVLGWGLG